MLNVRSLIWAAAGAVAVAGIGSVASGAIITQYQFTGTESGGTYALLAATSQATTVAANATATAVTPFSPNTVMTGANYGWSNTSRYMTVAYSSAGVIAAKGYFEFTVSAAPGYELDLSSISLMAGRGGSSGPRTINIHSSVEGLTLTGGSVSGGDVALGTVGDSVYRGITPTAAAMPTYTYTLGSSYQDLSSVTFRTYFMTPGVVQQVDVDNIIISGTVAAVPEPMMGAFGAASLLLLRRRRAK
jgi:hypothetical protein